MKPGRGKEKGGAFEREIAVELSLWLTCGESKDAVVRSEGSGARYTATKKVGTPGDMMPKTLIAFRFCDAVATECKHWKDLEIMRFLACKGELFEALRKIEREAIETKKQWFLIARQNNRPTLLFLPYLVRIEKLLQERNIMEHVLFSGTVRMLVLKEFLLGIRPEEFIGLAKEACIRAYASIPYPKSD